jgi:hypothetical protein
VEIGATMGFKADDTGLTTYTSEFSVAHSSIYVFISLTAATYTQVYRYVHGTTPSWYSMKSDLTYSTNNWSCVSLENGMFCCNGVDQGKIRNNRWLNWGVDNPSEKITVTKTAAAAVDTEVASYDPGADPDYDDEMTASISSSDGNTRWIKFTTGATNVWMNKIQLFAKRGYNITNIKVWLCFSAGTKPGSMVFKETGLTITLDAAYDWATITLSRNYRLQANKDYWVGVTTYGNGAWPLESPLILGCDNDSPDGTAGNYGSSVEYGELPPPYDTPMLHDWANLDYDPGFKIIYYRPATSASVGTWKYAMTLVTPDGYETMATKPASVTLTSDGNGYYSALRGIPVAPSRDDVYKRYLYRTMKGGSTLYFLAELNDNTTTTYDDEPDDTKLGAQYDGRRREPPPTLSYLTPSEGRIVGTGNPEAPNFIYVCETYQPQWWDWSDVANSLLFDKVGNNEANTGI